jgi:hypothetical protein
VVALEKIICISDLSKHGMGTVETLLRYPRLALHSLIFKY